MNGQSDASARSRRFEGRSILHLVSAQYHCRSGSAAAAVYRNRRSHEAGYGQSGVAVEYAPLRRAARYSRRRSDHGDVDRRDRFVGRQRRHRLGLPDDDDRPEVRHYFGGRDWSRAGAGGGSDQWRRRRSARRSAAGDDTGNRDDDGRHHHRLQPENIGVALDRAGLHPFHRIRSTVGPYSSRRNGVAADCGAGGGHARANRLWPLVIRNRR